MSNQDPDSSGDNTNGKASLPSGVDMRFAYLREREWCERNTKSLYVVGGLRIDDDLDGVWRGPAC